MSILNSMLFLASPPHQCSYLPNQKAVSVFAAPETQLSPALYSKLAEIGFRRSGDYVYTPNCPDCKACEPIRIPVNDFTASRSQKRIVSKNNNIVVKKVAPVFNQGHFELFCRYVNHRHAGGGMDNPTTTSYIDFVSSSWSKTYLYEFYLSESLIAISVVDQLDRALSAVYTFFEPKYAHLSLGSFAILWLIEETRRTNGKWLYLGYFIQECQKMKYKSNYRPFEVFSKGHWVVNTNLK